MEQRKECVKEGCMRRAMAKGKSPRCWKHHFKAKQQREEAAVAKRQRLEKYDSEYEASKGASPPPSSLQPRPAASLGAQPPFPLNPFLSGNPFNPSSLFNSALPTLPAAAAAPGTMVGVPHPPCSFRAATSFINALAHVPRPLSAATACAAQASSSQEAGGATITTSGPPNLVYSDAGTVAAARDAGRGMVLGVTDDKGGRVADVSVEVDVAGSQQDGPLVSFGMDADRAAQEACKQAVACAKAAFPPLRGLLEEEGLVTEEGDDDEQEARLTGTVMVRVGHSGTKVQGGSLGLGVALGTVRLLSRCALSLGGFVFTGVLGIYGLVEEVMGLRPKAAGADIVHPLKLQGQGGHQEDAVNAILYPKEQKEDVEEISPASARKWRPVGSFVEAVKLVLPARLRMRWATQWEEFEENGGMLTGNVLTFGEHKEDPPVDVAATSFRGRGRVEVTGVAAQHAEQFVDYVRRYLHHFLVKLHPGASFRVRYGQKGIIEDEEGNPLDLLVSVGSPGDCNWLPSLQLPIAAALNLAMMQATLLDRRATYVVTGGVTDGDVVASSLEYGARPGTNGAGLFGLLPSLWSFKPSRGEEMVLIVHESLKAELGSTPARVKVVGIRHVRQLPLAMGHTQFGGTGALEDAAAPRMIGQGQLFDFAHGEVIPSIGVFLPEGKVSASVHNGVLQAIARVEEISRGGTAAAHVEARHSAEGFGERWRQFDSASNGKFQVPYLPECFPRDLLELSQTAKLDYLGKLAAKLGWTGDTTSRDPAAEAAEVKALRGELEAAGGVLLAGMVAISITLNKQLLGVRHPTHYDPSDVCGIVVYTALGAATLELIHPTSGEVVLRQALSPKSAYVLVGKGASYYKHRISEPTSSEPRLCYVVRYVRQQLLDALKAKQAEQQQRT